MGMISRQEVEDRARRIAEPIVTQQKAMAELQAIAVQAFTLGVLAGGSAESADEAGKAIVEFCDTITD